VVGYHITQEGYLIHLFFNSKSGEIENTKKKILFTYLKKKNISRWREYVNTYVIHLNTSRTSEEGAHSPSQWNGLPIIIIASRKGMWLQVLKTRM
jgi:hypothetical protein